MRIRESKSPVPVDENDDAKEDSKPSKIPNRYIKTLPSSQAKEDANESVCRSTSLPSRYKTPWSPDVEAGFAVEPDDLALLPLGQDPEEEHLYAEPCPGGITPPPPVTKIPNNAIHYQHPKAQLLLAVKWNHVQDVERLLAAGFDPDALFTMSWYEAEAQMQYIPADDGEERSRFNMLPTWPETEKPVWTALHSAAARAHAACVRALLAHGAAPDGGGNTRRTPLDVAGSAVHYGHHVQRDHLAETIQLLLEAGGTFNTMRSPEFDNLNTPLHTATLLESVESIKLLLDAGASVACVDSAGYTPLHLCLRNKLEELMEVLLYYNCDNTQSSLRVNVVDKRGYSVLKTAVELKWLPGVCLALEAGADATSSFDHLDWQAGQEIKTTLIHLAVQGQNMMILEKVLIIAEQENLINSLNVEGDTPLCVAITKGHIECAKSLLHHGASVKNLSTGHCNALHVAAKYGRTDIMQYLLESNSEYQYLINAPNKDGLAPIHLAAKNNHPECVQLLLKHKCSPRLKTDNPNENRGTALHFAARGDYVEVARAIISADRKAIEDVNNRGFTPLHEAAYHCSHKIIVFFLHETEAVLSSLTASESNKQTAIRIITSQMPNPADFFETVFDSFTHYEHKRGETEISVNYGFLTARGHVMTQIQVVEELVRCGQRSILLHPLMESLLYLKWKTLLPFFYVMLAIYGMFVLTLNLYVVTNFYFRDSDAIEMPKNFPYPPGDLPLASWAFTAFVYTMITLMFILELFFLTVKKRRYFSNLETWIRLACMVLAGVLPPALHIAPQEADWPRHLASATILLAWLEMLFLLSRFPNWGYYVLMFGEVAANIFKILLTFVFLILGFSLSFMIQYRSKDPFDNPWTAFIKTIVMMTQEFDYDDLFDEKHMTNLKGSSEITRFLFVLFLMFVGIVLMNFMVGVAVSNVNELNVAGNTKRLEKQVELLITLDYLVYGLVSKVFPINTYYKRYHWSINNFPNKEKLWRIMYYFDFHDSMSHDDEYFPLHLRRAIITKALEQNKTAKETSNNTFDKKMDVLYGALIDKSGNDDKNVRDKNKLDSVLEQLGNLSTEVANLKEQVRGLKEIKESGRKVKEDRSRSRLRAPKELFDSMAEMLQDMKKLQRSQLAGRPHGSHTTTNFEQFGQSDA